MIKRQYVVDYEIIRNGEAVKWGTQAFETQSWFTAGAGEFADEVRRLAVEPYDGFYDAGEVRIVGVFKL